MTIRKLHARVKYFGHNTLKTQVQNRQLSLCRDGIVLLFLLNIIMFYAAAYHAIHLHSLADFCGKGAPELIGIFDQYVRSPKIGIGAVHIPELIQPAVHRLICPNSFEKSSTRGCYSSTCFRKFVPPNIILGIGGNRDVSITTHPNGWPPSVILNPKVHRYMSESTVICNRFDSLYMVVGDFGVVSFQQKEWTSILLKLHNRGLECSIGRRVLFGQVLNGLFHAVVDMRSTDRKTLSRIVYSVSSSKQLCNLLVRTRVVGTTRNPLSSCEERDCKSQNKFYMAIRFLFEKPFPVIFLCSAYYLIAFILWCIGGTSGMFLLGMRNARRIDYWQCGLCGLGALCGALWMIHLAISLGV
jgi:hypothetical protein